MVCEHYDADLFLSQPVCLQAALKVAPGVTEAVAAPCCQSFVDTRVSFLLHRKQHWHRQGRGSGPGEQGSQSDPGLPQQGDSRGRRFRHPQSKTPLQPAE